MEAADCETTVMNPGTLPEDRGRRLIEIMDRTERVELVDLSHTVEHGLITYRGLPAPVVCDFLSREASHAIYGPDTEFHIGKIEMIGNTGTYVDAPFHRFAEGKDLADLPLSSLAELPAVVIRPDLAAVPGNKGRLRRAIDARALGRPDVAGRAVLIQTGWSRHWATERYFEGHPFLTEDAAVYLRDHGAVLVGIDSLNIDSTDAGDRPVHTTLLGADIPVCEHLCGLEQLPAEGFRFSAVPVKVRSFGTFPVRAYATVPR
jgi:arylformamidase